MPCAEGYYAYGGAVECTPCPEGSYCPSATDGPNTCPLGKYSEARSTNCTTCEAGFRCPESPGNLYFLGNLYIYNINFRKVIHLHLRLTPRIWNQVIFCSKCFDMIRVCTHICHYESSRLLYQFWQCICIDLFIIVMCFFGCFLYVVALVWKKIRVWDKFSFTGFFSLLTEIVNCLT